MLMCWMTETLFFAVSTVWLAGAVGGVTTLASRFAGKLMIPRKTAHGGTHALATFAARFCGKRTIA